MAGYKKNPLTNREPIVRGLTKRYIVCLYLVSEDLTDAKS